MPSRRGDSDPSLKNLHLHPSFRVRPQADSSNSIHEAGATKKAAERPICLVFLSRVYDDNPPHKTLAGCRKTSKAGSGQPVAIVSGVETPPCPLATRHPGAARCARTGDAGRIRAACCVNSRRTQVEKGERWLPANRLWPSGSRSRSPRDSRRQLGGRARRVQVRRSAPLVAMARYSGENGRACHGSTRSQPFLEKS